jgi:hypothetical protein
LSCYLFGKILDNAADNWRQELMGLAQQVQSSLLSLDESRSTRISHQRPKRSDGSLSTSHSEVHTNNDEQFISKRLLHRRASARHPDVLKPRISLDENLPTKNQDPGIWVKIYIFEGEKLFFF